MPKEMVQRIVGLLFLVLSISSAGLCQVPATLDLSYENHNQIDYGPLKLKSISGYVLGPKNEPFPEALVLLFTEKEHTRVLQTRTDSSGQFEIGDPLSAGFYRLVVKCVGLCTANVPLQHKGRGRTRKKLFVYMRARSLDGCSYGDLR